MNSSAGERRPAEASSGVCPRPRRHAHLRRADGRRLGLGQGGVEQADEPPRFVGRAAELVERSFELGRMLPQVSIEAMEAVL